VGRITAWVLGLARESEAGIGVCGDQENGVGRLLSRILRMQRPGFRVPDSVGPGFRGADGRASDARAFPAGRAPTVASPGKCEADADS